VLDMARRSPHRWSHRVATVSTFPPAGLFASPAETIAATMARPDVSPGGLGGAIRMVTFFANRAGRNLTAERAAELARARRLLQARRAEAVVVPPERRVAGAYRHAALGEVTVERRGRGWAMRRGGAGPPIALGPDGWAYLAPVEGTISP
jgi:hypothetical protein